MKNSSPLIQLALVAVVSLLMSGCSDSPKPLARGEIIQCMIRGRMEHPTPMSSQTVGEESFTNGTVAIFPTLVIITDPEGKSTCAPIERVAILHFRQKR